MADNVLYVLQGASSAATVGRGAKAFGGQAARIAVHRANQRGKFNPELYMVEFVYVIYQQLCVLMRALAGVKPFAC